MNVDDDGFIAPEEEEPLKKRKYQIHPIDDEDDNMPIEMRHLRSSMRTVRPKVYSNDSIEIKISHEPNSNGGRNFPL